MSQEFLAFHVIFCVLLAALVFGLKLVFNPKDEDIKKEPVLQSVAGGCLIFTILSMMMPNALQGYGPIGVEETQATFVNTLMTVLG